MKRFIKNYLALILGLIWMSNVQAQAPTEYTDLGNIPNELLVAFSPGTSDQDIYDYAHTLDAEVLGITPWSRVARLEFQPGGMPSGVPGIIIAINPHNREVEYDDIVIGLGGNQSIILGGGGEFSEGQDGMLPTCNQVTSLNLDQGDQMVRVAIIDTGVDLEVNTSGTSANFRHGELAAHHKYDIGYDFIDNKDIPADGHGHGTHVAGCIDQLASGDRVEFLTYRVFDNDGYGSLFNVLRAIDEAVLNDANIINCSFRFYYTADNFDAFKHVIDLASDENILIVAGMGNEGNNINVYDAVSYYPNTPLALPACFDNPNVLSVASSRCGHGLSDFSNYGYVSCDLAAPGEQVQSYGLGGAYNIIMSGTSQSTAIVSGVAAALATHLGQFDAQRIKCALLESVDDYGFSVLSGGIVNASAALSHLLGGQCEGTVESSGSVHEPNQSMVYLSDQRISDLTEYSNPASMVIKGQEPMATAVFPNPAREGVVYLTLSKGFKEVVNLRLMDTKGSVYMEQPWATSTEGGLLSISIGHLRKGVYIVEVQSGGQVESHRLIIL